MSGMIVDGDMQVRGNVNCNSITLPQNAIDNSSQVKAGTNLNADKLEQRFFPAWSQPNSAASTETRTLFVARRSGTVNEVIAGSIAKATGDAVVTLDVKKNGTTILNAVITLDNANTNRLVELGSVTSSAFVAGDWFEVVITATANTGTLPTGVFVQLEVDQAGA